jgi:hypothetical protein
LIRPADQLARESKRAASISLLPIMDGLARREEGDEGASNGREKGLGVMF